MTGISYKVSVDDAEMRARLEKLMERMTNREGFFKNVGERLLNSVGDNFDKERGPDGVPWQPLELVTIEARQAEHGDAPLKILRETGDLRGSINKDDGMIVSEQDVRIGSAKVYAAIHNFGGKAGRDKKTTIPARPYLGMSAEDQEVIMGLAEDWLALE